MVVETNCAMPLERRRIQISEIGETLKRKVIRQRRKIVVGVRLSDNQGCRCGLNLARYCDDPMHSIHTVAELAMLLFILFHCERRQSRNVYCIEAGQQ